MSRPSGKAKLETALLRIWYGGNKPSVFVSSILNTLESIYKILRAISKQEFKSAQSKGRTNPPVLIVGNLIAGGAGKTPIVMAVSQYMQAKGKKVGIVSRGYARKQTHAVLIDPNKPLPQASEVGDEPLLLCAQTHCPVAVNADRHAALELLLQTFPDLDLVISDDGLQHHRLKRQIEWVVFDARGQGNGRLLPAGPLREPLNRLNTVDAVIASNTSLAALSNSLNLPKAGNWHEVQVGLRGFRHLRTGEFISRKQALERWAGQSVAAFTGIANPEKMFTALRNAGMSITKQLGLPDHFQYPDDFCMQFNQAVLITSGKDAVKLDTSNTKVWVVEIRVDLPATLTQALEDNIGSTID